jgi:N-methylhydantoinase B
LPGGGGFGPPLERCPQNVAEDVAEGLVSPEAALAIYGVVLGRDGHVDADATAERRKT